jgi:carbonic anhydrase/acetyltransferase-like protein (isoleucine patch superfamily)
MILEFEGSSPQVAQSAFVAPTAVLIGDVWVGENASIWFGAVLRGDEGRIHIGARTSVQDNAVLHCTPDLPTVVEDDVTIGHGALLEGCTVGSGSLIGMGAIVLNRARVGPGSIVAAGSVVKEGDQIGSGVLAAGVPATEKRQLNAAARRHIEEAPDIYRRLAARYRL